jgi:hypothetical protein
MRLKERIKPFLELVDWEKAIDFLFPGLTKEVKDDIVARIHMNMQGIEIVWNEAPDLRITQVLVNTDTIPNYPGFWYYKEEHEILLNQGIPLREFLMWGNNYDKDMNRLPETKWLLLKDMNTDHIEAILDGDWAKSELYVNAFKEELEYRKSVPLK